MYMERALQGRAVSNETLVSAAELPFEFMLNALRLREGFDRARFTDTTGQPLHAIETALHEAVGRGLLAVDGTTIRPTDKGFDFLSDVQALFLASTGAHDV
jgi:coproporphyrinogen III oxidase-like Fe-S oxidoreductase